MDTRLESRQNMAKAQAEEVSFISINTSKALINYEANFVSLLKESAFYGRCVCITFSLPDKRTLQKRLWDNPTHQRLSRTFESFKVKNRQFTYFYFPSVELSNSLTHSSASSQLGSVFASVFDLIQHFYGTYLLLCVQSLHLCSSVVTVTFLREKLASKGHPKSS